MAIFEDGKIIEKKAFGMNTDTTISVQDIFYNVPITFSSVLELEKAKKIGADQDENFAPIYVYGRKERG